MRVSTIVLIFAAWAAPTIAFAAPMVGAGGTPGAVASWTEDGKIVRLKLDGSFDPEEVCKAIEEGVPGAKAQKAGDHVVVSGIPMPKLLKALERVEIEPVSDDIEAMLSTIQNPGGSEDGSGSSIRATKEVDFSDVLGPTNTLIAGRVVKIRRARFPLVFVTVQITGTPKNEELMIRKGAMITVLPRVKSRQGVVDPDDKPSRLNVGAWYAQPGDRVNLRLEKAKHRGVFVAQAFERIH